MENQLFCSCLVLIVCFQAVLITNEKPAAITPSRQIASDPEYDFSAEITQSLERLYGEMKFKNSSSFSQLRK